MSPDAASVICRGPSPTCPSVWRASRRTIPPPPFMPANRCIGEDSYIRVRRHLFAHMAVSLITCRATSGRHVAFLSESFADYTLVLSFIQNSRQTCI